MINFFSGHPLSPVSKRETFISSDAKTTPMVQRDPWYVSIPLILITVLFLGVLVIGPLVNVFVQAFAMGGKVVWDALTDAATYSAIKLTIVATTLAVLFNLTFGLAAAWALTRYRSIRENGNTKNDSARERRDVRSTDV